MIVPTRALAARADLTRRALATILDQQGVSVATIVVVNGADRDPRLIRDLESDPRLTMVFRDRAHLPHALRAGRERVTTTYVTTLDDDDELLPGALSTRVAALEANADWDAVVSNGFIRNGESQVLKFSDLAALRRDPVRSMMRRNWLLPGAWLARTSALPAGVFEAMPEFLECTYLGYWLALCSRLGFLEAATLVWGKDTPLSASKSRAYVLGQAAAHRQLLNLPLPPDVRANISRRVGAACHGASRRCLREGGYREAWTWHVRSLREPGGWRWLPYTLRLIHPFGNRHA